MSWCRTRRDGLKVGGHDASISIMVQRVGRVLWCLRHLPRIVLRVAWHVRRRGVVWCRMHRVGCPWSEYTKDKTVYHEPNHDDE